MDLQALQASLLAYYFKTGGKMTRLLHNVCRSIRSKVNRSFRLFSIGPRIQKQGVRLVATSALRLRILSLGAFSREVVV